MCDKRPSMFDFALTLILGVCVSAAGYLLGVILLIIFRAPLPGK